MVWVAADHYRVAELDFTVRATAAGFCELLRDYLGEYLTGEEPGHALFSADCGVERTLPGGKAVRGLRRLYEGTLLVYSGRSMDEMAGRLITMVRDITTNKWHEYVRLRAGSVALNGAAVLLPSDPQSHLPGLVAHLLRKGASYLADEVTLVDPILRQVHPLRLPLLLDSVDVADFPELTRKPERLPRSRENRGARAWRRPVRPDELGAPVAPAVPVGGIVFPEFVFGAPTELREMGASEALFRLTRSVLNMPVWGDRALLLFRDLVGQAPASRLTVGSLAEAAAVLFEAQAP